MLGALAGCSEESLGKIYDDDSKIASVSSYITTNSLSTNTNNLMTFSARSFSGVKTLRNNFVYDGIYLDAVITVVSGEFKLVLVDDKGNVYLVAEGAVNSGVSSSAPAGKYILKAVGRKAREINVTIKIGG